MRTRQRAARPGARSRRSTTRSCARLPRVERELLQSQVEVSTPPSADFAEARGILAELRAGLAEVGREHGILVLAAGTHPVARWSRQSQTQKDRYETIMQELRMLGRRNVVCGMHIHVEVPRPEARVDLMNRLLPYMPLAAGALHVVAVLARDATRGWPATACPRSARCRAPACPTCSAALADYERYVAVMTRAGAIADASFLWWTLRPSVRYPTLELRIADSCTRLDDTLAIAALYRCLVRLADRRPELNRGLTGASRALAAENLWRAQRDGVRAQLIDEAAGNAVPFASCLDATLSLVAEDADALGCQRDVQRARVIVAAGTSADCQLATFAGARERGLAEREALNAVVDWLAAATAGRQASLGGHAAAMTQ